MNRLCLVNNHGWSFTYHENTFIQVKDKFGIDYGEAPYIYLNDLTSEEMEKLEASEGIIREQLITQFLISRFVSIGSEIAVSNKKRTFQIQCCQYNGKPFIIFEKYGLHGGGKGKILSISSGVAKVGLGVLIAGSAITTGGAILPLVAACGGSGLLSSGIGDMAYGIKTPENNITAKDYAIQSTISFAAGVAGGGVGMGVNALGQGLNVVVTTGLSGAASSASSLTAATLTEAAIKQDTAVLNRLTPKKVATTAITGVLTGGVSNLCKGTVEAGNSLFNSSSRVTAELTNKTLVGATAGALSGSAVKVTENFINKYTFLQVMYETKPENNLIECGKLYVYAQNNEIFFQSINEQNQMIITRIRKQDQFLMTSKEEIYGFSNLLDVLKSNKRRQFSSEQQTFLLKSASNHNHIPVKLLSGTFEAAVTGGSSGAVIGLTKGVSDKWQRATPPSRAEELSQEKLKRLEERERIIKYTDMLKKGAKGGSRSSSQTTPKPGRGEQWQEKIKQAEDLINAIKKQKGGESRSPSQKKWETENTNRKRVWSPKIDRNARPQKKQKTSANENAEESCVPIQGSPEQIAAAQKNVDQTKQQYGKGMTFSGYTDVDMENIAKGIFNKAEKEIGGTKLHRSQWIENELAKYGIPMGTVSDTLDHAYRHNAKNHVPDRIKEQLIAHRDNGSGLAGFKQDYDNAVAELRRLNEPKCVPVNQENALQNQGRISPQISAPANQTINIEEYVNHAANSAEKAGYKGNVYVEMKNLSTEIAKDYGLSYNDVYNFYLRKHNEWNNTHHSQRPTRDGFLNQTTDFIINGQSTIPVEQYRHSGFSQGVRDIGNFLSNHGINGVGFQVNGEGLQPAAIIGRQIVPIQLPTNTGNIDFQLPSNRTSDVIQPTATPVQQGQGVNPSIASNLSQEVPTSVFNTANTLANGNGASATHVSKSVDTTTSSTHSNTPFTGASVIEKPPLQPAGINQAVYTVADTTQTALKNLDKVPGLEGLGSHAGGAVGKIMNTLSTLERIDNPVYQDEPTAQRIGCGVWGSTIEMVGGLVATPIGGLAGVVAAGALSPFAAKAGDDAQQNCHDVINMFK